MKINPVYFHDPSKQRDFSRDMLQKCVIEAMQNLEIPLFEPEQNRDVRALAMFLIWDILLNKLTEHETKRPLMM